MDLNQNPIQFKKLLLHREFSAATTTSSHGFPMAFLIGWFTGFAVGLPTSLLAMPLIVKLVKKLTTENP